MEINDIYNKKSILAIKNRSAIIALKIRENISLTHILWDFFAPVEKFIYTLLYFVKFLMISMRLFVFL